MPNTKENDTNTDPLLLPAKKKKKFTSLWWNAMKQTMRLDNVDDTLNGKENQELK